MIVIIAVNDRLRRVWRNAEFPSKATHASTSRHSKNLTIPFTLRMQRNGRNTSDVDDVTTASILLFWSLLLRLHISCVCCIGLLFLLSLQSFKRSFHSMIQGNKRKKYASKLRLLHCIRWFGFNFQMHVATPRFVSSLCFDRCDCCVSCICCALSCLRYVDEDRALLQPSTNYQLSSPSSILVSSV